jgi:hypothetical protein
MLKSAKEYWKDRFGEYPKTDSEKLAVAMMSKYSESQNKCSCPPIPTARIEKTWVCIKCNLPT